MYVYMVILNLKGWDYPSRYVFVNFGIYLCSARSVYLRRQPP